jgi:Tfp pilus assembly protein PilF
VEEAMEKYKQATKVNPNDSKSYCEWANILRRKQMQKEAREKYALAVQTDPNNTNVLYNWGLVLFETANYSEAINQI